MRFLLDQNVAESVAAALIELGHDVTRVRDILPIQSADQIVATAAENEGAVLVSHDKDFRRIAPRIPDGQRRRFSRLSRISLDCTEPEAARRIRETIDFIELAWKKAQARHDKRMIVAIGSVSFRIEQ